jgi:hypothetical protein
MKTVANMRILELARAEQRSELMIAEIDHQL